MHGITEEGVSVVPEEGSMFFRRVVEKTVLDAALVYVRHNGRDIPLSEVMELLRPKADSIKISGGWLADGTLAKFGSKP